MNNKLYMNAGLTIGLLILSILFALMSDWADNRLEGYTLSALEMVGFFGAVMCLVGSGFTGVFAYQEWLDY